MRRKSKSKKDDVWLKEFGKKLEQLILSRGYSSVYDFWTKEGHRHMSRASLNYIVAGQVDPKVSTIRDIINAAKINTNKISELLI